MCYISVAFKLNKTAKNTTFVQLMKLYLCTDLEGVSGVIDFKNYCFFDSRYYEMAKRLLTREVNAAVEGFFQGGVKEITVMDGHGPGAINPELLDERVNLLRGHYKKIFPWGLDEGYDAMAVVGQHAKSNTPFSHLSHTSSPSTYDLTVNGVSIGEYGQMALCAMELGIPTIFAAGEKAFAAEAEALTPGVVTVWGKRGLLPDDGSPEVSGEEYWDAKLAAEHVAIGKVHKMLTDGARLAAQKYFQDKTQFHYPELHAPFEIINSARRPEKSSPLGLTCHKGYDDKSYIAALNDLYTWQHKVDRQ